eukprot:UN02420
MATYPALNEGGGAPPAYNEAAPSAPTAYNPSAVQQQTAYQPAPQQQTAYQPAPGQGAVQQVVYQQPTQQGQPQTVYVNQYGQQIAAPTQQASQPQVVYVQAQAQPQAQMQQMQQPVININTNQNTTQQATQQQVVIAAPVRERPDDPSCLYILACFGFFFWPIGAIGMCIYSCGSNLPPRQAQAFKVLVAATLLGVVLNIIYYVASS